MPTINSFYANPTSVSIPEYDSYTTAMPAQQAYGTPTRLYWSVSDFKSLSLTCTTTSNSADVTPHTVLEVAPMVDTTYTLTATGADGSTVSATTTVTVSNPSAGSGGGGGGGGATLAITSFSPSTAGVTSANNGTQLNWTVAGVPSQNSATIGGSTATVPIPTGVTVTNSATGGWLFANTYYYWVTAFNGSGVESKQGNAVSTTVTGNTNQVTVTWSAVTGAVKYRVYRSTYQYSSSGQYIESTTTSAVDSGAHLILDDNNGTVVDVSPNNTSGAYPETPAATTTYTLKARDNAGNIVTANTTVIVSDTVVPVIDSFTASSVSISYGQVVTLQWSTQYANSVTIDHGGGTYSHYYNTSVAVCPATTTTYTLTATNSAGSTTQSLTVSVSSSPAISLTTPGIESHHPYQGCVYNFPLPDWPGGTQTAYLTFGLETYVDYDSDAFTISTDLQSVTFTGIEYAGYTLAIQSSDGMIAVDTTQGIWGEYYGFRVLSVSYAPPPSSAYMIGNPNSEDYPSALSGATLPNYVLTDTDADAPFRLCPAMTGYAYSYTLRLPNGTSPVFAISSGTLPAGLSLDSATGVISGTPTGGSNGAFTVTATSASPVISTSQAFVIPVYAPPVQIGASVYPTTVSGASPQITYLAENLQAGFNGSRYAFHVGTKRYCLLARNEYYGSAGQADRITAFTSTDDGLTWTEVANPPAVPVPPGNLTVGITDASGDGGSVTYTFSYGPSETETLHVGDWMQVSGFHTLGFNGLYKVVTLNATTFVVANTTLGTEHSVDANGSNYANASRQQVSTYPTKEYPPSYTDNNVLTQTGMLGTVTSGHPFIYYDGANSVYAVTTLTGSTGTSSYWAGSSNSAHVISQTDYFLWKLDLTTDTWSCLTPSNYFYSFTTNTRGSASYLTQLSTGAFRLFFYGSPHNDGVIYNNTQGVYFTDFDVVSGVWSSPVQLTSDVPIFQSNGFVNSSSTYDIVTAAHQATSFVDSATLDVTHAILHGLYEAYGGSGNPGYSYNFKYLQITGSGIAYSYVPSNIIYSFGNGVLVPSTNEYVVAALVHDHFPEHANQVYSATEPAVLRFKLDTPASPTFTEEATYQWNVRTGRFDTMPVGAKFQYMYVGVDSNGHLFYFASGQSGIDNGNSANTVYLLSNIPATDGSTDKSWGHLTDAYSVEWCPYRYLITNQYDGSSSAAYGLSVDGSADGTFYYVNFDGQDANGNYVNMTVVLGKATPLIKPAAFMFSRMGNVQLALPQGAYQT